MDRIRLGFAVCGSFCTFDVVLRQLAQLQESERYRITPIMSEFAYRTDTRFGKAADIVKQIEEICGERIIHTIDAAEPIGPKRLLDLMVVAPCTGNTLGKLAHGITDTAVTMAVKAHLRNARPVVLAVSSNDALSASAQNIGLLLNRRLFYFVPMRQDDSARKPTSVVANFSLLSAAMEAALQGEQLQPVLC